MAKDTEAMESGKLLHLLCFMLQCSISNAGVNISHEQCGDLEVDALNSRPFLNFDMPNEGAESITYDSGNHNGPPLLRFTHYNDVYHIEAGSRDPVGGIARFKTLCQYYQQDKRFEGQPEVMTLFSEYSDG
jgi:hypothetical protein